MLFAAHESKMRKPAKDGEKTSIRTHLEHAAARGNARAQAALNGPEFPVVLTDLWDVFLELDRARDIGFNGPLGFTYQMLDAYSRLMDRSFEPYEVSALFSLDLVMRFPEVLDDGS